MARRVRACAATAAVLLALVLAGCTANGTATTSGESSAAPTSSGTPPVTSAATGAPKSTAASGAIRHIVVILEENKPATSIIGNPDAPYFNGLATRYAHASDYSAVSHPSLPNYLALTSGTTGGITSDCNPPRGSCLVTTPNLADSLQKAGLGWRMYAEDMPAPCTVQNSGLYAVKHNPFLYYPSVTASAASCAAHDVPFSRFGNDLASASTLPAFSFISPNLCNDMHSCPVATGDAWLAREVPLILASPAFTTQRSLLVVTFDEGDSGDNTVACVFAGPAARAGAASAVPYTHYSLLRTIEDAFRLPTLNAGDAAASPMADLLAG